MRFIFVLVFIILSCSGAAAQSFYFQDVNFHNADSIAEHYADHSLKDHKALAILLTKDLSTDVEKFRAIFKWITENISYDIPSYIESVQMEKKLRYKKTRLERWREKFYNTITKRIIREKTAICYGYASLLTSMSDHAGIPCKTISGYGRGWGSSIGTGSVNHAWNAVKLQGRWFLCDPTWASGTVDMGREKFFRQFDKVYFITSPDLLIANHYPADTSWTLIKNAPSKKEFLDAPIKLSSFLTHKINHYFPQKGIIKIKVDSTVRFSFTTNASKKMDKVTVVSKYAPIKKDEESEFDYNLQVDKEGKYFFDHRFIRAGFTSLVIYLNGDAVLVYNVYISKA